MRVTRLFRTILGFARAVVERVTIEAVGPIEVAAKPSARRARCGGCGRKEKRLHGTQGKAREWRHLGMWGRRVIIKATVHRVLCGRCGVRTMEVPWARPGSVFTRTFENEVAWMLQRTDQTTVSRYFRVSWRAVGRIARRVVAVAPQAEIVYDRFHVVQLLNAAVDEVRREGVRNADCEQKRSLFEPK